MLARLSAFVAVSLLAAGHAQAEPEFCRTAYCDPGNGIWYPRNPPGAPYGREVKLSPDGEWIDHDGHRAWAEISSHRATVLSMANSDERNGELAYQTAYDSFMEGKYNGGNKVEKLSKGRWTTRITTPDGIVLYKDAANSVAVQSPDGKWHVTNSQGQYASTAPELDARGGEMVATKAKSGARRAMVAKGKKKKAPAEVADAKKDGEASGRKLASVDSQAADAGAPPAVADAAGADGKTPAKDAPPAAEMEKAAAPAADGDKASVGEKLVDLKAGAKPAEPMPANAKAGDVKAGDTKPMDPMEAMAKLAEAGAAAPAAAATAPRAPASAAAKPAGK